MATKNTAKSPIRPNHRVFQRGLPLVIQDGQVDGSLIEIAQYISGMFKHFEHEGKVPVQANIDIKVIVLDD